MAAILECLVATLLFVLTRSWLLFERLIVLCILCITVMADRVTSKCTHVIFDLDGLMIGKGSLVPAPIAVYDLNFRDIENNMIFYRLSSSPQTSLKSFYLKYLF